MDILFSTPNQMEEIVYAQKGKVLDKICPYFVVFDEADLIFRFQSDLCRDLEFASKILSRYSKRSTQFIMSGASKPVLQHREEFDKFLNEYTNRNFINLETPDYSKIPSNIEHEVLFVEKEIENNPYMTQPKLLAKTIKESKSESIIVFFNDNELILELKKFLDTQGITSEVFFASFAFYSQFRIKNWKTNGSVKWIQT